LKPACEIAEMKTVENLDALKHLLHVVQTTPRSTSPVVPNYKTEEDKKGDEFKQETKTKTCHLPRVQAAQNSQLPRFRPHFSSGVRYPSINHLISFCPNGTKHYSLSPLSAARLYYNLCTGEKNGSVMDLREELNKFHDNFETKISKLQEMFTVFSQRVLVPLQTFCKHSKSR